ncbi:hypothetical protein MMC11_004699 [Xylographa trunciseda]|nr:hypothetical protein [Xylographa trunciseda]
MSAPPPLPPRRPAPPVPVITISDTYDAPQPLPPRRTPPPVPSTFGIVSPTSLSMSAILTIPDDTRPETFLPAPPLVRPVRPREPLPPAPTPLCGPPYLVQPLFVSKGKNRKVTILAHAGKKRRVTVEEFNRLNGHPEAADSAAVPGMPADEDPMVGSSSMPPPPPPTAPAPAPAEPWRPATPPADMWKIKILASHELTSDHQIGTPKTETWWLQEAAMYRERLMQGDLRRETRSLVKSRSLNDLLAEREGPDGVEHAGYKDGQDRYMRLAFEYLDEQTHNDARAGLTAAKAKWEAQEAAGVVKDESKLTTFGRRLLKKPSTYFQKQSGK